MRITRPILTITATAVVLAVAGCGGSSGPESSVNGCAIQPATACTGIDLSGANLAGANLSQADLSKTNLENTNLSGANLTEANLSGAQIVNTDLSDANLTSANLTGATITGANLDGATFCGTTRTDGTTDDTSCPASTETIATETQTTVASAAEVTSFDVGDMRCTSGAATAPVEVSWETGNATAVEIEVDSFTPSPFGPSGMANVTVPCDGESHEISITPKSDAGPGEVETKEVSSS
jgi:hypothetical protein